ncbi:MAG TPA: UbiD family decarboxylase [Xanthobacteraceae bacterium]|nr:UbiD family decarboxylase [Xanthobacteraceae bacterium]
MNRPVGLSRQSLRAFLSTLAGLGELASIKQPVSADFEIAAALGDMDAGPALRFDQVVGHTMPVVGNLLNSRARIADGLGTTLTGLQPAIISAIETPQPHRVVQSAPCQEVVVSDPVLLEELPIPRFFEHEAGPYITAGAIVAKDRQSGDANLSIARLMPLDKNRAFVGIAPNHHLAVLARAAHARGETLDIAVCIGNHPAVLVASCLYLRLGDDELKIAGALLGEPLDVVRCLGHDLLVPAHCECVLEGTLDAGTPVAEGPVSEFHGLYEDYGPGILATFARLTRRRDCAFQVILPGYHPEHCLLGGVAIAAGLARAARASVSSVIEVAVTLGGAGRLHAVVSLRDPRPGDARKVAFAIWASVNLIKQIVVVDADIDPWNSVQVEWAIATRMKPDRDLIIVPGVRADRSEPLESGGTITKLAIDATRRDGDRPDWTRAEPPEWAIRRAREILRANAAPLQSTQASFKTY